MSDSYPSAGHLYSYPSEGRTVLTTSPRDKASSSKEHLPAGFLLPLTTKGTRHPAPKSWQWAVQISKERRLLCTHLRGAVPCRAPLGVLLGEPPSVLTGPTALGQLRNSLHKQILLLFSLSLCVSMGFFSPSSVPLPDFQSDYLCQNLAARRRPMERALEGCICLSKLPSAVAGAVLTLGPRGKLPPAKSRSRWVEGQEAGAAAVPLKLNRLCAVPEFARRNRHFC